MSGQPTSCYGGPMNGVWTYQEDTADGKHYYMRDAGPSYGVAYLYFDRRWDGGKEPRCNAEYGSWDNWIIDNSKPSTAVLEDLDGDESCERYGNTVSPDSSGGLNPPPLRVQWIMNCNNEWMDMALTFHPVCAATAYTYTYPEHWTPINLGCGTGIAKRRTEIETCRTRLGCACTKARATKTETVMQENCA